ncbi:sphingosine N-acyltransferase lag1 [Friedmanniomyces endolithicus]|nr:sphingosine N-acyltransferase lag1 [Friedmanniomyces endolithicus]
MAANETMEAFPSLSTQSHAIPETSAQNTTRRRRQSSTLGGDPRGDTGAGAIATNLGIPSSAVSAPASPSPADRKASSEKRPRERKRKKALKLFRRWKRMSFRHTWVNPLILILVVLSGYFVSPGKHNPLHSALFLSYANPPWNERTNTIPAHVGNVTQYGKGPKDLAFVAFYTVVLTFTREFLMQQMIRPIGIWCGIRARGKLSRFMEQFYTAIYFGVVGPLGFWVMSRTPVWYFNTTSKIFNYLDFWITGPYFVMFLCIWAYLRHYINLLVLKTLLPPGRIPYTNIRTGEFATVGPYELNWELQQYKSSVSQPMVFLLLASLQTINIIWFFLLVRIALRYLIKGEQKDERSEDEAEEEEMPEPRMGNGLTANGNVVKPVAVE